MATNQDSLTGAAAAAAEEFARLNEMIHALQHELGASAFEKGRVTTMARRLRVELSDAHTIIRAQLNILTTEQKFALGHKTADIAPDGITRANEREALLAESAWLESPEQAAKPSTPLPCLGSGPAGNA